MLSCDIGLIVDPSNAQIASLKLKCHEELTKVQVELRKVTEKRREEEEHWTEAWGLITGNSSSVGSAKGRKGPAAVAVGYASASQQPAQLEEVLPHVSLGTDRSIRWPVVFLYPQYSQIDVIQGVDASDMIAIHLAEMFPELADLDSSAGSVAVSWDRDGEYQVSQLAVYAPLEAAPRINTLDEWLDSCREQRSMRGVLGREKCETALEAAKKRSSAHDANLSKFDNSNKIRPASKQSDSKSKSSSKFDFDRVGYLDVHLGCTFQDILTSPGHVLAGGLLTLLIFVRGNEAHSKFLRDTSVSGRGVWPLTPSSQ